METGHSAGQNSHVNGAEGKEEEEEEEERILKLVKWFRYCTSIINILFQKGS
jgi:hypothetical protein